MSVLLGLIMTLYLELKVACDRLEGPDDYYHLEKGEEREGGEGTGLQPLQARVVCCEL